MYAITGVTGRVGGATAQTLMEAGQSVRAVLRNGTKAADWRGRGADVALASFSDIEALAHAFAGMEGIYVMLPPDFDPDPGFSGARTIAAAIAEAVRRTRPGKVIALSSIGGQHSHDTGLIGQTHILEQALAGCSVPLAILRPAWFMENSFWDIEPARSIGRMPSFLAPLDRAVPMIATADIGRIAARVLQEEWQGRRVIEIEGPQRYSQIDIAGLLGKTIGRPVEAQAIPREEWETLFKAQGMERPGPRIEMIDGFNSGWIDFEPGLHEHVTGQTSFETVLARLARQVA